MPRKRERKTTRGQTDISTYKKAYDEVKAGSTLRGAASKYGINYVSLRRYKKKREEYGCASDEIVDMGYKAHNRVFSQEQENELSRYLMSCTETHVGVTAKECRKLVFEWTVQRQLTPPTPWVQKKMAGEEWFRAFIKRHLDLFAEAPGMIKKNSPNKTSLENLQKVMEKYQFKPQDIYNLMEIGITTLPTLDRVVLRSNSEQVKILSSAEGGSFVTVTFTSNVLGHTIPPLFVFPEVEEQEYVIRNGPTGSIGTTQPSGWIHGKTLLLLLNHLKEYTKSSVSRKVLIIIDSLTLHLSLEALQYCRENGIVLLSFPLQCLHKFQPLIRTVYEPLRKTINKACVTWTGNNSGNDMSVHDIPSIVAKAMPIVFTEDNIRSAFFKTGIHPIDQSCFMEYLPSKSKQGNTDMQGIINAISETEALPLYFSLSEKSSTDEVPSMNTPEVSVNASEEPDADMVERIRNSFFRTTSSSNSSSMNTSDHSHLQGTVKTEDQETDLEDQYSEFDASSIEESPKFFSYQSASSSYIHTTSIPYIQKDAYIGSEYPEELTLRNGINIDVSKALMKSTGLTQAILDMKLIVHNSIGGPEECKRRWASIRDQFRRTLQKRKAKSGQAAAKKQKYKYEEELEFLLPHIVDRETITNAPSLEDKRDDPEVDPRMEEPELDPESEAESRNEVFAGTSSQTIVQPTSPVPPAGSTQATPGKKQLFARPVNLKRRGFNFEKPAHESPSSQLMAYILAEKEAESNRITNSSQHPLDIFLAGLAPTLKSLDPVLLNQAKTTIFAIVQEFELKQISRMTNPLRLDVTDLTTTFAKPTDNTSDSSFINESPQDNCLQKECSACGFTVSNFIEP